jgi:hypothetical protein
MSEKTSMLRLVRAVEGMTPPGRTAFTDAFGPRQLAMSGIRAIQKLSSTSLHIF